MHDVSSVAINTNGVEQKKTKSLSKKLFKTIKHSTYGSSKARAAKKAAVKDKSLISSPDDFRVVQNIRRTESNDLVVSCWKKF
jgi:hypothetical protein